MSVYVDALRVWTANLTKWKYGASCHMVADTEQELHDFATKIGLRKGWFQGNHYDLTEARRNVAVKAGAIEVDSRALVELIRKHRQHSNATKIVGGNE